MIRVIDPRCEYLINPLGMDDPAPRLSWRLSSSERDQRQTAFQVQVASNARLLMAAEPDIWDSGKVAGDRPNAAYGGPVLRSRQRCHWRVRVWDGRDAEGQPCDPAWWEMGLLEPGDWQAAWIEDPQRWGEPGTFRPSYFRHPFVVREDVRSARVYATALGLYQLELDGRPVADDLLRPGWTDYHTRTVYQVYDVTDRLTKGSHAFGTVLADGWFSGPIRGNVVAHYGAVPKFLLQLEVTYVDGQREIISTGPDWRCSFGPIASSDILNGETYDARLEMPGWSSAGFDADGWRHAVPGSGARTRQLVGPKCQPVRRTAEFDPRSQRRMLDGSVIIDFGQNIAGRVRLRIQGAAGTTVSLRHAALLDADGAMNVANMRNLAPTDRYTLKGDGEEVFEPSFIYRGFRYVELCGLDESISFDVTGVVLHTDTPLTGEFECSDPFINQLQHSIVWSQRSNSVEVPTCCPDRDERTGSGGDWAGFARTACWNMDVSAFFTKWLDDVLDAQRSDGSYASNAPNPLGVNGQWDYAEPIPHWGDSSLIFPWTVYLCYGDTRILDRHFEAMARWVDLIHRHNPGLIWRTKRGNDWGDWGAYGEQTPKDVFATACFARSAFILSEIARRTGRDTQAHRYQALFVDIRAAFQRTYVSDDGRVYGETQTAYLLALAFDLLPGTQRHLAAQHLVARIEGAGWHPASGFPSIQHLLPALSDTGHLDVAYRLLRQRSFPSWGYMIEHGSTTFWEGWAGWTEGQGLRRPGGRELPVDASLNCVHMASFGEWLYSTVAGIDLDVDQPGYQRVIIRPRPDGGLSWAGGALDSVVGTIRSVWHLDQDGHMSLEIEIPAGSTAQVFLPDAVPTSVAESGRPVAEVPGIHSVDVVDGAVVIETGSGRYAFDFISRIRFGHAQADRFGVTGIEVSATP